ncbi:DUF1444 family protein [Rhizomonospora bruguierae]|uniref:DUF1444 family protein n=1 Tax=Rhizomonospora bruguierae TaxID=1581705 RepID=UPI001BCF0AED|nr:DUF1444 family protein [Micromonospora sp. NBRC 107566]
MQVRGTHFLPLLVSEDDPGVGGDHLLDEFIPGLAIAYSFGPPYGQRLVTWDDLEQSRIPRRAVRREATENLYRALDDVEVHGRPPALMLSFGGLESSVLLADEFWDRVEQGVPGELVVGVPARDVVIITGSQSRPGLAKARRAVDRVFFAGDQHLLSQDLLVRREQEWMPFLPEVPAERGSTPRASGRVR